MSSPQLSSANPPEPHAKNLSRQIFGWIVAIFVAFCLWFFAPGAIEKLGAAITGNPVYPRPLFLWSEIETRDVEAYVLAQIRADSRAISPSSISLTRSGDYTWSGTIAVASGISQPLEVRQKPNGFYWDINPQDAPPDAILGSDPDPNNTF